SGQSCPGQAHNRVAGTDEAAFDDPTKHATPPVEFATKSRANLFKLTAGSTYDADFEQCPADKQALAGPQPVYVEAGGGDAFAGDSGLELCGIERCLIDQKHLPLAAARPCVRAARKAEVGDGLDDLNLFHRKAASCGTEQVSYRRHGLSFSGGESASGAAANV